MATRSPACTPRSVSALAARQTSSVSSRYVIVRVSPGSPSKWNATRSPRPASTWRSRQFTATLSRPSANHFAKGAFDQSRTCSNGCSQVRRRALSAQNARRSSSASRYASAVTFAAAANSSDGGNRRDSSDRLSSVADAVSVMSGTVSFRSSGAGEDGQHDPLEGAVGDDRERRVPGEQGGDDAEVAADVREHGGVGRGADAEREEREGQEREHRDEGAVRPRRRHGHVEREDAERDEEDTDALAAGGDVALRRDEVPEREPEAAVGAERGRAEGVLVRELPDAGDELAEAAVEGGEAEHRGAGGRDDAGVREAQHERGERERGEAERAGIGERDDGRRGVLRRCPLWDDRGSAGAVRARGGTGLRHRCLLRGGRHRRP